MKKLFLIAFSAVILASCENKTSETKTETTDSTAMETAPDTASISKEFTVDTTASTLHWTGKKVTGSHEGQIKLSNGKIDVQGGQIKSGTVEINMNSISNADLKDTKDNEKLIGHLKSDDFFGTTKYPTSKLEILSSSLNEAAEASSPLYNLKGNLTIKNITKPVEFPATIVVDEQGLTADGEFDIDRTEFEVKFGSGKFFQNLGDKMIDDKFHVKFHIVGK